MKIDFKELIMDVLIALLIILFLSIIIANN
jgi:hypothetical protein